MRLAILGGPGSGKGSQAQLLAKKYRVPKISTGDLLRAEMNNDKQLGKQIKATMDGGQLVSNEIVLKLLEQRLSQKDTKRGFIIDGYPRNIPQAQALDNLLGILGKSLQVAIYIKVDEDILAKRISGRQICEQCNSVYNRFFYPSQKKGVCDQCGEKLTTRTDDNAKSIQVRIGVYGEETMPLITYYRAQHKLRTMPGDGNVNDIHEKLCALVDVEVRPLEITTVEIASDLDAEEESIIIAGGKVKKIASTGKPRPKKKVVAATIKQVISKKTTKKKVAKKKAIEKPPVKEKVTKKKVVKKKVVEKTPSKKPVTKKKVAKKQLAKKKPVQKKVTKKKVVKKKVVKKTPAKKPVTKKSVVKKKAVTKKAQTKKTTKKIAKKSPIKKVANKKATKKKAKKK